MPGRDGTGPLGLGPMTGRGAGFCTGYGVPGYANYPFGRGFRPWGGGRGGGRGFRHWFYGTGLTGWQRMAGGMPAWGHPYGYGANYAPPAPVTTMSRQQELDFLKGQAEYLEDMLENIRMQLKELEGGAGKTSP